MIEVIPVMLFILGWHPDRPGELDLQRPEIVFTTTAECEAAGAKMIDRMNTRAAAQSGAKYQFRCVAVPSSDEFEAVFGSANSGNESKDQ